MNFNSQVVKIEPSKIKEFNEFAKANNVIYNLAIGEPYFETPKEIKKSCIDALNENYTHYAPTAGFLDVRDKIAKFENNLHQTSYNYNNVIITTGSTESIFLALLTILNENDEVIVFLPVYNLYRPIVEFIKAKVIVIDTEEDQFQINKIKLLRAINTKTKAIIINNPNNPTGIVYDIKSYQNLFEVVKKFDIWLIMDSVYEQILFTSEIENILIDEDLINKIIICQSFSKSYAMTGWRIGYLLGNEKFIEYALKLHQLMMVSVNSFVQRSIITALDTNNQKMVKKYLEHRDYAYNRLIDMGLTVSKPMGSLYLFPSIKKYNLNSLEFCKQLVLKYQTAFLPSSCFEVDGYIRISYCVNLETLKIALDNLELFLKDLKTNQ